MAKAKAKSGTKCTVPKTKKIAGKIYKISTKKYRTKSEATAAAKRHREGGKSKTARVLSDACGPGYRVAKRG